MSSGVPFIPEIRVTGDLVNWLTVASQLIRPIYQRSIITRHSDTMGVISCHLSQYLTDAGVSVNSMVQRPLSVSFDVSGYFDTGPSPVIVIFRTRDRFVEFKTLVHEASHFVHYEMFRFRGPKGEMIDDIMMEAVADCSSLILFSRYEVSTRRYESDISSWWWPIKAVSHRDIYPDYRNMVIETSYIVASRLIEGIEREAIRSERKKRALQPSSVRAKR